MRQQEWEREREERKSRFDKDYFLRWASPSHTSVKLIELNWDYQVQEVLMKHPQRFSKEINIDKTTSKAGWLAGWRAYGRCEQTSAGAREPASGFMQAIQAKLFNEAPGIEIMCLF